MKSRLLVYRNTRNVRADISKFVQSAPCHT